MLICVPQFVIGTGDLVQPIFEIGLRVVLDGQERGVNFPFADAEPDDPRCHPHDPRHRQVGAGGDLREQRFDDRAPLVQRVVGPPLV